MKYGSPIRSMRDLNHDVTSPKYFIDEDDTVFKTNHINTSVSKNDPFTFREQNVILCQSPEDDGNFKSSDHRIRTEEGQIE